MFKTVHITEEEPIYTGAMSAFPYSDTLFGKCTFKTAFDDIVNMGLRKGDTILVPRELAPIAKNDYRVSYPPGAINCTFVPRNYEQATLTAKSIGLLKQGRNHIFD